MIIRIYYRMQLASYDATAIHGVELSFCDYDCKRKRIVMEGSEFFSNRRFRSEIRRRTMRINGVIAAVWLKAK